MKNLILLFIFCSLLSTHLFSQLKVTTANNIGIGTSSTSNSKTYIFNSDQSTSLLLSNTSTLLSTKYGIRNSVIQDPASTNITYGLLNEIEPFGTGNGFGIYSQVSAQGFGRKFGIFSSVRQTATSTESITGIKVSIMPDGTGKAIGIDNNVNTNSEVVGDGEKIGVYNYVRQKSTSTQPAIGIENRVKMEGSGLATGIESVVEEDGTGGKWGFHNRVNTTAQNTAEIRGIYNYTKLLGAGTGYGIYNYPRSYATTTGTIYGIYNYMPSVGSGTRYGIYSITGGTGNYAGYFVGDVYINGNLTHTSDERLKTEVQDISGSIDRIMALKPKSYKMKDKPNGKIKDNNRKDYGFVAQELALVFPDLVTDVPVPGEPIETITTKEREVIDLVEDEEGNLVEKVTIVQEEVSEFTEGPGDTYKSVDYTKIIPFLVRAIQEQQVKIEELEAEMKELKKK